MSGVSLLTLMGRRAPESKLTRAHLTTSYPVALFPTELEFVGRYYQLDSREAFYWRLKNVKKWFQYTWFIW